MIGTIIVVKCECQFWREKNSELIGGEGVITGKLTTVLTKKDLNTLKLTIRLIVLTQIPIPKCLPKYGTVKSLYDTYFSQYCVRKKYIHGYEDHFLEFFEINQTYLQSRNTQTRVTKKM